MGENAGEAVSIDLFRNIVVGIDPLNKLFEKSRYCSDEPSVPLATVAQFTAAIESGNTLSREPVSAFIDTFNDSRKPKHTKDSGNVPENLLLPN